MPRLSFIPVLLVLFTSAVSCTSLHEAQHTLAVADSLRAEGVQYSDSISIANTVSTLSKVNFFYPADYAKANYYYGRLLRERGSQPEAMQCFINASHIDPATPLFKRIGLRYGKMNADDYNLLGRIFSNMGTMCHDANEYGLSYQMYEQSAKRFKKANNTTAVYYALNAMAFQLAEQKKAHGTYELLNIIRQESTDTIVIAKTCETEAILKFNLEQYDSAIYAVDKLQQLGNYEPTGYVTKARAFWFNTQYDSALFYAKYIVDNIDIPDNYKYDILYILAYNDTSINKEKIKQLTEERSDIEEQLIEPQKKQLAIAVEKLKHNLDRTRYHIFVILFFVLFAIVIIISYFSIRYIKKQHIQSIKSIEEEQEQATQNIKQRQEELYRRTVEEQQKQAKLRQQQLLISQQIDYYNQKSVLLQQQMLKSIEQECQAIRHSHDWQKEMHWKNFDELCCFINEHFALFANKLKATKQLDEKEIRLCILVLLNFPFSNDEMAEIIIYSKSGFGKYKYRMTQKLGTKAKDLREFLLNMIVSKTSFWN